MHEVSSDGPKSVAADANPTVLFVGGMPRAGTTLLSDILGLRPDVGLFVEFGFSQFLMEMEHLFSYFRLLHRRTKETQSLSSSSEHARGVAAEDGGVTGVADPEVFDLRTNRTAVLVRRYPTPDRRRAIAQAIFSSALDKPHLRIIGCKVPLFFIDHRHSQIVKHFPDVRYVLMLRGPKGQINSSINRRNLSRKGQDSWPIRNIGEAIDAYVYYLTVACSYLHNSDLNCLFVVYESLIRADSGDLSRIGDFVGIEGLSDHEGLVGEETDKVVLTDEEAREVQRRFSPLAESWPGARSINKDELGKILALGLRPVSEGVVSYLGGNERAFLGAGWSVPDDQGVWTSSEWADLIFVGGGSWLISATFMPFIPNEDSILWVTVDLNGRQLSRSFYTHSTNQNIRSKSDPDFEIVGMGGRTHHELWLGPLSLTSNAINILRFKFDGAVPPSECGGGPDPRLVGLKLQKLRMIKA